MRFEHNGMSLWYGTPDAPAPKETVQAGTEISITVGVEPMDGSNIVELLYSINQGSTERVVVKWLRNDSFHKIQYFRTRFPGLRVGDQVEYAVLCRRAGRQMVPTAEETERFPSSFHVIDGVVKSTTALALNDGEMGGQAITPSLHGNGSTVSPDSPVAHLINPTSSSVNNGPMPDSASNIMNYEITGQLINQDTGALLVGFTVHAFDLDAGSKPKDLGYQVTNGKGLFALVYSVPSETSSNDGNKIQVERSLQLHVLDPQANEIYQTEVRVKSNQELVVEVLVPVPKLPILTLNELASNLQLKLPQQLLPSLAKHGISTLADIREAGGISHIEGLPVAADHSAVQTLEAHANLSALSPDVQFNNALIERGYTTIDAIANASRADFISAVGERVGDVRAATAYITARAQTRYLDTVLAGVRANLANGFPSVGHLTEVVDSVFPESCSCSDCEAMAMDGPLAYLAGLLAYTVAHLKNDNAPITMPFLAATLHQPFGDLIVSCEAVSKQVRQVRICIEVLRGYLNIHRPTPALASALDTAEKTYLFAAYTSLLNKIGTSYTEVRLARTDTVEKRQALADRLGIDLGQRPSDHLDALFLDPSAITEQILEELFGLVDTTRDPLSDGAKRDDLKNLVSRWNFEGAEWGRNTDKDGIIYASLNTLVTSPSVGPGDLFGILPGSVSVTVDLFKDSQRKQMVASGGPTTPSGLGTAFLSEKNRSRLSGRLEIANTLPSGTLKLEFQVFPRLLSWRLEHLRTLWKLQDWPVDMPSDWKLQDRPADPTPEMGPVIDPDIIGPDDFRTPITKAKPGDPDKAFDIWKRRRDWVDARIQALQAMNKQVGGQAVPDLASILASMYKPITYGPNTVIPWTNSTQPGDFTALYETLVQGTTTKDKQQRDQAVQRILADLKLTVESFIRLVLIYEKDTVAQSDPRNEPVQADEWSDVYAILVQAQKANLYPSWTIEEQASKILLGPRDFWISLREPQVGEWPIVQGASPTQLPLIDPDTLKPNDLPEPTVGARAIAFWQARQDRLKQIAKDLKAQHEQQGWGLMRVLQQALGDPNPGDPLPDDVTALANDLNSPNAAVVGSAQMRIMNDLHMAPDSFTRLMAIKVKDEDPDPFKKPTAGEWAEVYAILTRAQKEKREFPIWIKEEQDPLTGVVYWNARKARLPRWRAPVERRQEWQDDLLIRSRSPLIDPDLIGLNDLKNPVTDDSAFLLWRDRGAWVKNQLDQLKTMKHNADTAPGATPLSGFNTILTDALGISVDEVVGLAESRENGDDILSRLQQLSLTVPAFLYLLRLRNLVNTGTILDTELDELYSILLQVKKRRTFAEWREDEKSANMTLGPDYFAILPPLPPLSAIPTPPQPLYPGPISWRATEEDYQNWQDTLQTRIDEEKDTASALQDAVSVTEMSTLPNLRDALVLATPGPAWTTLEAQADEITNMLLIDTKVDGCQMTTRVSQAIETLQGLLFSLKNGQYREILVASWWEPAAVSWGNNRIDVFVIGTDNALWHKWFDNGWQGWESLGGPVVGMIASNPAVASWGAGRLDVFVKGTDGALWHKWFDGSWHDWESLGGVLTTIPAASSWAAGRLDVFVQGTDNALWHIWFDGSWHNWESLGGVLLSSPAVVSWGNNRIDVFAQGTDSALWHKWFDGIWHDWESQGGLLTSGPTVASWGAGRLDVFARGNDGILWHKWFDKGWHDWEPLTLTLDADNFEEEWQWIGSYATWRAAMRVFLYPENVLSPTLRQPERQTKLFADLVDQLRSNPSFTPKLACETANQYADYLRDVCHLDVQASCMMLTPAPRGDCQHKSRCQTPTERNLLYLFALPKTKSQGQVYFSIYDSSDTSGYGQSFWIPFQGLDNVEQVLGAVPYTPADGRQLILLFARMKVTGVNQLKFTVYDVLTQSPTGNVVPLTLPADGDHFTVAVEQRDTGNMDMPPRIFIAMDAPAGAKDSRGMDIGGLRTIFMGVLNSQATGWDAGFKFYPLPQDLLQDAPLESVLAVVGGGWVSGGSPSDFEYELIFFKDSSRLMVGYLGFPRQGGLTWPPQPIGDDTSQWLGALNIGSWIYAYIRNSDGSVTSKLVLRNKPGDPIPGYPGPASLAHFAVHCGWDVGGDFGSVIAPYQDIDNGPTSAMFFVSELDAPSSPSFITFLAPSPVNVPFDLTAQLSEADLQDRADAQAQVFKAAQYVSLSNLIYFWEAFYFVPMLLALQLQQAREYKAALDWFHTVYDYTTAQGKRLIFYGFGLELAIFPKLASDCLQDALNPHAIAETRPGRYLRYTLMALADCLLEFADEEFTRDTSESVARARSLYMMALDLLALPELQQVMPSCEQQLRALNIIVDNPSSISTWNGIRRSLADIGDPRMLAELIGGVSAALATVGEPWTLRLERARVLVDNALAARSVLPTLRTVVEEHPTTLIKAHTALLREQALFEAAQRAGTAASTQFLRAVSNVTHMPVAALERERVVLPVLRDRLSPELDASRNPASVEALRRMNPGSSSASSLISMGTGMPVVPEGTSVLPVVVEHTSCCSYMPSVPTYFCIRPNLVINNLRIHAELSLYKLRHCRNIAGLVRQLEPYAAPIDNTSTLTTIGTGSTLALPGATTLQPTAYRYSTLIERAKQLVQLAAQSEAAMLSALEKKDLESYNLLKARQDVSLTQAQVSLQDLRVHEAQDGVQLAALQQARAQFQANHYQNLIDNGLSDYETAALAVQTSAVVHLHVAAALKEAETFGLGGIGDVGNALAATASLLQVKASYERRNEEWQFQRDQALQDVGIGAQQVVLAQDHVQVAGQERAIAALQADHAEAVVNFLTIKFTNAELYDWMSSVLKGVYSFFLQQATSIAQLAANQLAFERQQVPPPFIQADYWEPPSNRGSGGSTVSSSPDLRGLTGSARLLQDIYQLDQYAFLTNSRKLQLSKTLSLAQVAPAEFQIFRQTGVLAFGTPMSMFDAEFPGHYLRLIHRVRTSVIALIPPAQGIRATLSTTSVSRVVIGGITGFQTVEVRRDPQSVALSSPRDATGLFELDPQADLLLPFEGLGVDTSWELSMPRAANQFDYRSIADVLITIEYTALESFDYRQKLVQELNARPIFKADRPFSFRNELADQWYDLNNPEQTATPMTVTFSTQRDDFPVNLTDLRIQQIVLYFARATGQAFEVQVTFLRFTEEGSRGAVGGGAASVDGIISTRRSNAGSWNAMKGRAPLGMWVLALPETAEMKDLFKGEAIDDILFVISYSGRTPLWPS